MMGAPRKSVRVSRRSANSDENTEDQTAVSSVTESSALPSSFTIPARPSRVPVVPKPAAKARPRSAKSKGPKRSQRRPKKQQVVDSEDFETDILTEELDEFSSEETFSIENGLSCKR